ncbi:hypothetical protein K402DRAFT_47469 [Aulographum hederae CBS 113979]|uniref:Uncharacterized protein n=1 Tax=Aulographum hederae CBS 113979 TaxID=1176131 RepID=A0A6G1H2W1_9PEZI|nr:hypothetical protein K402DRAFT_47469 [Aulographum hederae CBS 113979]
MEIFQGCLSSLGNLWGIQQQIDEAGRGISYIGTRGSLWMTGKIHLTVSEKRHFMLSVHSCSSLGRYYISEAARGNLPRC